MNEAPQNRGADGRFLPGNRSNPGGRPRGVAELVRRQTKDGRDIITFMVAVMEGRAYHYPDLPRGPHKGVPMVPSPDERLTAAQWLADRLWGKAPTIVEASVDVDAQVSHFQALQANVLEADVDRLVDALLGAGKPS